MPIPKTRAELIDLVTTSWEKLATDLARVDAETAELVCVDDWTIRDLLAVRVWWTEAVLDWIETGRRGDAPITPAPGYRWRETPRLNADIIADSQGETFEALVQRLTRGAERVLSTIDSLSHDELLEVRHFAWAGKYPIARWISLNTARQYTTARTYVRRVLRQSGR